MQESLIRISKHFHVLDDWQHFISIKLNMLSKGQFSVKYKTKIASGFFRFEDKTSNVVKVE